jgi:hypothetical protein
MKWQTSNWPPLPGGGQLRPWPAGRPSGAQAGSCLDEGVKFGDYAGGFGRADPLEDLQRLLEAGLSFGDVADGLGTAAQAG